MSTRVIVMSARPGRIVAEFPIPFPYPRQPEVPFRRCLRGTWRGYLARAAWSLDVRVVRAAGVAEGLSVAAGNVAAALRGKAGSTPDTGSRRPCLVLRQ